jgi:hypothetical protein
VKKVLDDVITKLEIQLYEQCEHYSIETLGEAIVSKLFKNLTLSALECNCMAWFGIFKSTSSDRIILEVSLRTFYHNLCATCLARISFGISEIRTHFNIRFLVY